jgi:phage terminase small subunit
MGLFRVLVLAIGTYWQFSINNLFSETRRSSFSFLDKISRYIIGGLMPRRKQTSLNPVISRPLTIRQKKFAEEVVLGRCSQTEAARRAGYAESSAHVRGCELLDIGKFPHVANYINDLRLDLSKKYEVTYEKHVQDLGDLRDRAAANNQFSAAINAETNRGKVGGLYVDRKEVLHAHINAMSKDDLIRRLEELDRESGGSLKTIVDAEFENVSKT